ncbi:MAG: DUF4199 domain-containing protein [Candidatus Levyibacteriota bacterium]
MKLSEQNNIRYGLLMAVITLCCLLLMEITGQNKSFDTKSPFQIIYIFIAPAIVWYVGIRAKKQMHNNTLSFKQGITEGFKISLVYGTISPFMFLLYYIFINPRIIISVQQSYQLLAATDTTIIVIDMAMRFLAIASAKQNVRFGRGRIGYSLVA